MDKDTVSKKDIFTTGQAVNMATGEVFQTIMDNAMLTLEKFQAENMTKDDIMEFILTTFASAGQLAASMDSYITVLNALLHDVDVDTATNSIRGKKPSDYLPDEILPLLHAWDSSYPESHDNSSREDQGYEDCSNCPIKDVCPLPSAIHYREDHPDMLFEHDMEQDEPEEDTYSLEDMLRSIGIDPGNMFGPSGLLDDGMTDNPDDNL